MEIMKIIALIMSLVLILSSCSSAGGSALEYQESSFETLISWSAGDTYVKARLISTITQENKRDITLSFEEPPSLQGLTLHQNADSLSASLGSLEIPDFCARSLIEIAEFFSIDGTLRKSCVKEIGKEKLNCLEYLSEDGLLYTVYISQKTALPRRIDGRLFGKNTTLEILEFKIT